MNHYIIRSEADLPREQKLFAANVHQYRPRRSTITRIASFTLQCIGGASFLFIAFGLIATFGSVA